MQLQYPIFIEQSFSGFVHQCERSISSRGWALITVVLVWLSDFQFSYSYFLHFVVIVIVVLLRKLVVIVYIWLTKMEMA